MTFAVGVKAWHARVLANYLAAPRSIVIETTMAFGGWRLLSSSCPRHYGAELYDQEHIRPVDVLRRSLCW